MPLPRAPKRALQHGQRPVCCAALFNSKVAARAEVEAPVEANTLLALGDLERRLGRTDEARGLYDRALALYEREQAGLGQANTLRSMGDAARLAGGYAEAAAIYQRALMNYESEQEPVGTACTFAELSRCWHACGEQAKCDDALEKALQWADRTNIDAVLHYVFAALEEVTGGSEQAEAWMASRAGGIAD